MLNGDLSNQVEASIAFRFDRFLFRRVEKGLILKRVEWNLDRDVAGALRYVYYYSPHTVDIVAKMGSGEVEEEFEKEVAERLDEVNLPYGRIFIIKHELEVRNLLTSAYFQYYIDDVPERVNRIASEYCMGLKELYAMFIRRNRYARI